MAAATGRKAGAKKTAKRAKKEPAQRGRKDKFSRKRVINALVEAAGIKYIAAKALGCGTNTLDRYIKLYDDVREAYEELRNDRVERMERALFEQGEKGNVQAIMFLLRTLGKDRGYAEAKPQNVGAALPEEAREILRAVLEGEKSVKDAAIRLEMLGVPLPESIRVLLSKEVLEEQDPSAGEYSVISPEEMAARQAAKLEELARQRAEFLPERRAEVENLKAKFGTTGESFTFPQDVVGHA